jgi:hypothetical protein
MASSGTPSPAARGGRGRTEAESQAEGCGRLLASELVHLPVKPAGVWTSSHLCHHGFFGGLSEAGEALCLVTDFFFGDRVREVVVSRDPRANA